MPLKAPYAPVPVSDVDLAFPAQIEHLMPKYDEEWMDKPEVQTWISFQHDWHVGQLQLEGTSVVGKMEIDPKLAFRHLAAIQRSYEPKHEHKMFAVAFLANLWFERIVDEKGEVLFGRTP